MSSQAGAREIDTLSDVSSVSDSDDSVTQQDSSTLTGTLAHPSWNDVANVDVSELPTLDFSAVTDAAVAGIPSASASASDSQPGKPDKATARQKRETRLAQLKKDDPEAYERKVQARNQKLQEKKQLRMAMLQAQQAAGEQSDAQATDDWGDAASNNEVNPALVASGWGDGASNSASIDMGWGEPTSGQPAKLSWADEPMPSTTDSISGWGDEAPSGQPQPSSSRGMRDRGVARPDRGTYSGGVGRAGMQNERLPPSKSDENTNWRASARPKSPPRPRQPPRERQFDQHAPPQRQRRDGPPLQQDSGWGAPAGQNSSAPADDGWGNALPPPKSNANDAGEWGPAENSSTRQAPGQLDDWGSAPPATVTSTNGAAESAVEASGASGWGDATASATDGNGWGAPTTAAIDDGWGNTLAVPARSSETRTQDRPQRRENAGGWGAAPAQTATHDDWGNSNANSNATGGGSAADSTPAVTNDSGWGATPAAASTNEGWGEPGSSTADAPDDGWGGTSQQANDFESSDTYGLQPSAFGKGRFSSYVPKAAGRGAPPPHLAMRPADRAPAGFGRDDPPRQPYSHDRDFRREPSAPAADSWGAPSSTQPANHGDQSHANGQSTDQTADNGWGVSTNSSAPIDDGWGNTLQPPPSFSASAPATDQQPVNGWDSTATSTEPAQPAVNDGWNSTDAPGERPPHREERSRRPAADRGESWRSAPRNEESSNSWYSAVPPRRERDAREPPKQTSTNATDDGGWGAPAAVSAGPSNQTADQGWGASNGAAAVDDGWGVPTGSRAVDDGWGQSLSTPAPVAAPEPRSMPNPTVSSRPPPRGERSERQPIGQTDRQTQIPARRLQWDSAARAGYGQARDEREFKQRNCLLYAGLTGLAATSDSWGAPAAPSAPTAQPPQHSQSSKVEMKDDGWGNLIPVAGSAGTDDGWGASSAAPATATNSADDGWGVTATPATSSQTQDASGWDVPVPASVPQKKPQNHTKPERTTRNRQTPENAAPASSDVASNADHGTRKATQEWDEPTAPKRETRDDSGWGGEPTTAQVDVNGWNDLSTSATASAKTNGKVAKEKMSRSDRQERTERPSAKASTSDNWRRADAPQPAPAQRSEGSSSKSQRPHGPIHSGPINPRYAHLPFHPQHRLPGPHSLAGRSSPVSSLSRPGSTQPSDDELKRAASPARDVRIKLPGRDASVVRAGEARSASPQASTIVPRFVHAETAASVKGKAIVRSPTPPMPLVPDDQIPPVQEFSPAEAARRKAATAAILSSTSAPRRPSQTRVAPDDDDAFTVHPHPRRGYPTLESRSSSFGAHNAAAFIPRHDSPAFYPPFYSPDNLGIPSPVPTPPLQSYTGHTPSTSFFAPAKSTKVEIKAPPGSKSPTAFRRASGSGSKQRSAGSSPVLQRSPVLARSSSTFSANAATFEPAPSQATPLSSEADAFRPGAPLPPSVAMPTYIEEQDFPTAPAAPSPGPLGALSGLQATYYAVPGTFTSGPDKTYVDASGMTFYIDTYGDAVYYNKYPAQSYVDHERRMPAYFVDQAQEVTPFEQAARHYYEGEVEAEGENPYGREPLRVLSIPF